MDAAGSGRAALFGASEGAPMSILFAATYPERTRSLVLYGGYAHFQTWVMGPRGRWPASSTMPRSIWGTGATLKHFAPGRVDDPHFSALVGALRTACRRARRLPWRLPRMNAAIDVRGMLDQHPRADTGDLPQGRRKGRPAGQPLSRRAYPRRAARRNSRAAIIRSGPATSTGLPTSFEEFLTGARPRPASRRMLAALLVARIVAPERLAARLGDRDWSERAARFRDGRGRRRRRGWRTGVRPRWRTHPAAHRRASARLRAARCRCATPPRHLACVLAQGHACRRSRIRRRDGGGARRPHRRAGSPTRAEPDDIAGLVGRRRSVGRLRPAFRRACEPGRSKGSRARCACCRSSTEQHLEPAARRTRSPSLAALSEREREVLKLVADGLSNPAIAGATASERAHGEAPYRQHPAEARPADPGRGGGARRARKAAVTGRRLARSGHRTNGAFGRSGRSPYGTINRPHPRIRRQAAGPQPGWRSTCRNSSAGSGSSQHPSPSPRSPRWRIRPTPKTRRLRTRISSRRSARCLRSSRHFRRSASPAPGRNSSRCSSIRTRRSTARPRN